MQVERYRGNHRRGSSGGLGCLILVGVVILLVGFFVLVLIPRLPGLALQMAGFQPIGEADALLEDTAISEATPVLQSSSSLNQITVDAGDYGSRQFSAGGSLQIEQGLTDSGGDALLISADENGLLQLCQQYSAVCGSSDPRLRNARFDLRPGGVIVRGEIFSDQLGWQSADVVVQVTAENRVSVSGVSINGTVYALPPDSLGALVAEAEAAANDALRQLAVRAGGGSYRLDDIQITDERVTFVLR